MDNQQMKPTQPLSAPMGRRAFVAGTASLGLSTLIGPLAACASEDVPDQDMSADGSAALDATASSAAADGGQGSAVVYFTREISPAALARAFEALGVTPQGNVAVKLSTGEPGGNNFLQPDLIADLVGQLGATIVECTTAYGGPRSTVEGSQQVAEDHGFSAIAPVDIMDADGSMSLPVEGGSHLAEDLVGAHLANYDYVVSLAHFKGHAMGGFGGAIKNCSIGIASQEGKMLIHSAGTSTTSWGNPAQDDFLESMAEAAKAVSDHFGGVGGGMCYVNVMNRLSVDCDCDSHPAEPEMADIGILASLDPVALDRACVDLVYAAPDGQPLIERIESRNGAYTLDHAEAIGLGSRTYELIDLDADGAAAGSSQQGDQKGQGAAPGSSALVAYFSATGNTAGIAQTIAAQLGADVFVITPTVPYTAEDVDYNDAQSRTSIERDDPNRLVELKTVTPPNFDAYTTVFLGYPIWWGDASWVMDGFASGNDFTGKTVVPFCTSGSSPIGGSAQRLADLAGNTGTWLDGRRFSAGAPADEISEWIASFDRTL